MKKYEHFDTPIEKSEPVISGVGKDAQTKLIGTVNKWVRLSQVSGESTQHYELRLSEDKKKMVKYRSHLLIAKRFDTHSARLVALATSKRHIGYGWMPVLGETPIPYEIAKVLCIWLNSTLGRLAIRRVTGRKISYPTLSPIAFDAVPFPNISQPHIISVLSSIFDETCRQTVPAFSEGRTPIREAWDDAVSVALDIDRSQIAQCAELLSRDPFVSKESFYDHL